MRKLQFIKGVAVAAAGLMMTLSAQAADLTGAGATVSVPDFMPSGLKPTKPQPALA